MTMKQITQRQTDQAHRHALENGMKFAHTTKAVRKSGKPYTWSADRVRKIAERAATYSAPKSEPAHTQWQTAYAERFTIVLANQGAMSIDESDEILTELRSVA